MKKYKCSICGYVYDEASGIPEAGIAPGTRWEDLPEDFVCPICGAEKSDFEEEKDEELPKSTISARTAIFREEADEVGQKEELKKLTAAELSAVCSNLAKGCEKQYLKREAELFMQLADYYRSKSSKPVGEGFQQLSDRIQRNLKEDYAVANEAAKEKPDRGALRALVWSEKVTKILNTLVERYKKEKDAMLLNTSVYVCEICGFIYIGDEPPAVCPVCKVPNQKLTKVERG